MIGKLIATSFIPVLLTGCFPYKYVVTPEVHGTVTDSRTAAPIHGATVTIASGKGGIYARSAGTYTTPDGKFHLPSKTAWGVYVAPQALTTIEADLRVEAAGYRTYELKKLGALTSLPERGTNSVGLQYGYDHITLTVPLQKKD